MSTERELFKGNTPTLVLAVLQDAPLHGYGIAREIERRSGNALQFKEDTLYPALHALEREGLITGAWSGEAGGRERKVYRITPAGLAELERRTRTWTEFATVIFQVIGGTKGAPAGDPPGSRCPADRSPSPRAKESEMDARIEDYLDHVCAPLVGVVPYARRQELRAELRSHLEALADTSQEMGSDPDSAIILALRQLGDPDVLSGRWAEEWSRGDASPTRSAWPATMIGLACAGSATLFGLALMHISHYVTAGPLAHNAISFRLIMCVLLPVLAGLATGALAPARHALGAFYAQAVILPALVLGYWWVEPPYAPVTLASCALELAMVQAVYWVPLGPAMAAAGGSLRRLLRARPKRWVLQ